MMPRGAIYLSVRFCPDDQILPGRSVFGRQFVTPFENSMSKQQPTFWISLAIAFAFLAVAVFGVITYHNTVAEEQQDTEITSSFTARETARELLSSLKDMESGQRGFLITGSASYLEPYQEGLRNLEPEFASLRELTRDHPAQHGRMARLQMLIDDKRASLREAIQARAEMPDLAGLEKARAVVMTGRGQKAMQEIRAVVKDILAEEERLLIEQAATAKSRGTATKSLIIAGNLVALVLLVLSGVAAHIDRGKRNEAEAQRRFSQAELAAIFDSAGDGIIAFNGNLKVRLMNPAAKEMLRCAAEAPPVRSLLEFVPSNLHHAAAEEMADFWNSDETSREFAIRHALRRDGSEFPCDGSLTKSAAGGESFITLMFRDLSETMAHQAKIREQAEILDQVRDAILVCDMDDRILFWNHGAQRLYGYSSDQAIGRTAVELLFDNQREQWETGRETLLALGTYSMEIPQVDHTGQEIIVEQRRSLIHDQNGEPVAQLILHFDITARKMQEIHQRRSQRLESLGTLSGGIAHDLNNVLTPILMSGKLLKRGTANQEQFFDVIVTSAERGARMIKKLLAFAGGEQGVRERIHLKDVLTEVEDILGHTLPKTIELRVDCAQNLPLLHGDPTELSQVLMNMAINARDAMPYGGRLDVRAENFFVEPAEAARSDILNSGPHILLTIADSGSGISRENMERIFDPFFTTKPQGQGTGLGLATSLGIIRNHGGEITVTSQLGQGTSFSILLPAEVSEASSAILATRELVPVGKGEKILLVDDEPLIVETTRAILQAGGYQVTGVNSGSEAVAYYRRDPQAVDLVLLDMMMPGLDGFATKGQLRAINPDVSIVASSGQRRPQSAGGRLSDINGFLAKPYSDDQLLRLVRQVLDEKAKTPQEQI
jgi:PAS domain S-box-containing protein